MEKDYFGKLLYFLSNHLFIHLFIHIFTYLFIHSSDKVRLRRQIMCSNAE